MGPAGCSSSAALLLLGGCYGMLCAGAAPRTRLDSSASGLASAMHHKSTPCQLPASTMQEAGRRKRGSQQQKVHVNAHPLALRMADPYCGWFPMQWKLTAVATSTQSRSHVGFIVLNCCPCNCPSASFPTATASPYSTTVCATHHP
jgi:hypothetical protein